MWNRQIPMRRITTRWTDELAEWGTMKLVQRDVSWRPLWGFISEWITPVFMTLFFHWTEGSLTFLTVIGCNLRFLGMSRVRIHRRGLDPLFVGVQVDLTSKSLLKELLTLFIIFQDGASPYLLANVVFQIPHPILVFWGWRIFVFSRFQTFILSLWNTILKSRTCSLSLSQYWKLLHPKCLLGSFHKFSF